MSITQLIAIVVEWPNRDAETSLLTATTREQATRKLMTEINTQDEARYGGLSRYDGTPDDWWHDNPAPTERADQADIDQWLTEYADISNVMWSWHLIDLTGTAPAETGRTAARVDASRDDRATTSDPGVMHYASRPHDPSNMHGGRKYDCLICSLREES